MNLKIFLCLILFFIIFQICSKNNKVENFRPVLKEENLFPVLQLKVKKEPEKIEITKLEQYQPEIFLRYENSSNHIYNDGRKIYQSTINLLKNRMIYNGFRFGLSTLEWHKSVFSWNGEKIGLELRLVHKLVENNKTIVIIFPLSLVDIIDENFADIATCTCNQKTDVSTLNSLLISKDQIPSYICCNPIQGKLINLNLYPVSNLIKDQDYFFKYEMNEDITWLITTPQPFNRYIGLNIREKLIG